MKSKVYFFSSVAAKTVYQLCATVNAQREIKHNNFWEVFGREIACYYAHSLLIVD
jgi:hypothetical protein